MSMEAEINTKMIQKKREFLVENKSYDNNIMNVVDNANNTMVERTMLVLNYKTYQMPQENKKTRYLRKESLQLSTNLVNDETNKNKCKQ